jgi:hypothetical protein
MWADTAPAISVPRAGPSGFNRGNLNASAAASRFGNGIKLRVTRQVHCRSATASWSTISVPAESRRKEPVIVTESPSSASPAAIPVRKPCRAIEPGLEPGSFSLAASALKLYRASERVTGEAGERAKVGDQ